MGWTAQYFTTIIIEGSSPSTGIFIYNGTPALGTLIGSWTPQAGVDSFGNAYPAGINVFQGQLTGVSLTNFTASLGRILNTVLTQCTLNNSTISGGTMTETVITFDSGGGVLFGYTTTTTTVTLTPANTSWTSPITGTAKVYCWGSDAGAGGGNSSIGGEGGGGGAFAGSNSYPVVAGQVYNVGISTGGFGGTTGNSGGDGGDTFFDNGNIWAGGGQAGSNFVGGQGGQFIAGDFGFAGGNGGGDGTQSTGGCGGGGRAGSTGAGGNGAKSTSSTGASGGAAGTGTGGHAGGNGGNAAANGNNGGGGGGCGAATASQNQTFQYRLSSSATYYGSDGGDPNQKRNNGTMYQGGETASGGGFNGTQKSLGIIGGNPQSDLAGWTIYDITIRLEWLHTWYNNGAYVILGYTNKSSLPSSWDGSGITAVKTWWQGNVGSPVTTDIEGAGLGSAMQSGAAKSICLGPGAAFDLYNYGYMYGAGGDNNQNPLITIKATKGGSPVFAGNGADGQIQITYSSTQVMEFALSPTAGTDSAGNAFGAGYTGPVQNFHPGSNPTIVETWQSLTLPSGLTGLFRVKKVAESNYVMVDCQVTWTTTTATTFNLPALPYSVNTNQSRIYTMKGNSTETAAGQSARLFIGSSGSSVQILVPASTGGGTGTVSVIIPID